MEVLLNQQVVLHAQVSVHKRLQKPLDDNPHVRLEISERRFANNVNLISFMIKYGNLRSKLLLYCNLIIF